MLQDTYLIVYLILYFKTDLLEMLYEYNTIDVAWREIYDTTLIETFDFQNICNTNQIISPTPSDAVVVIIVVLMIMIYIILFQNYLGNVRIKRPSSHTKRNRNDHYMLLLHCLYLLKIFDHPFELLYYFEKVMHSIHGGLFEALYYENIKKCMCTYLEMI